MEHEVKQFEEDVLLDRPISFTLKGFVKPAWWQFWKKKKFVEREFKVRRLRTWQNIMIQTRLSKITLKAEDFEKRSMIELYNKLAVEHHKDLVFITAICLSEVPCENPDKELIKLIEAATTNQTLKELWDVMITQTDAIPFIIGIASMKGISLTEVNPNP